MEYLKDHLLNLMRKSAYRPMTMKDLIRRFDVPAEDRAAFKKLIAQLCEKGDVVLVTGKRYGLAQKMNLVTGRLIAHPDGFGFVRAEEAEGEDIFIKARGMGSAMHGDLVLARLDSSATGRSPEGSIVRILKRAHTTVVGRLERFPGYGYVIPADHRLTRDIYISLRNMGDTENNQMVVAEIVTYPSRKRNPEGKIVEVLGTDRDPGVAEEVIVHQHDLPHTFLKKTLQEVSRIPNAVAPRHIKGRLDLRKKLTVTIDGETARDFDDAVSIELSPKSTYLLWVHVADVSHYVAEGSSLDAEAFERGTSVYFPGRVLPMLPEALSNGICSLNPNEDRLAMTVFMECSRQGKVLRHDFFETAIRSHARLTYRQVAQALQDDSEEGLPAVPDLLPALRLMRELALKIQALRRKRGSIDFDLPEAEILLDLRGNITDICRAERNIAHRIIEEFMISANETVAGYFHWLKVPAIYRVHEKPDADKLAAFAEFSSGFGHRFPAPHTIHPKIMGDFLASLHDLPEEKILTQVLLRSMKQAVYSMENSGHFGLASSTYTHFTSPIRRYPDLVVHRLLRELLRRGRFSPGREEELVQALPEVAAHSSERERVAVEAEREVVSLKKAEFMEDKTGEVFDGFITGVAPFGFFVEPLDYMVEGLVHVSRLQDDYYTYQEEQQALVGEHTKKIFRLGDQLKVRLDKVDREKRRIDFVLVPEKGRPEKSRPEKGRPEKGRPEKSRPAGRGKKKSGKKAAALRPGKRRAR
jgi:ribonuclease R